MRSTLTKLIAAGVLATASTLTYASHALAEGQPNWGGLYFGAGYGWMGTEVKGNFVTPPSSDRHDTSGNSQFRTGFVGLQHQWGQFVLGVEANYGGTGWSDNWDARSHGPSGNCVQSNVGSTIDCRSRIDSTLTFGPRVGYAPNNQWLVFGTGGYAGARIDTSSTLTSSGTEVLRTSTHHDGWFIGGGLEYSYDRNWTTGIEYQHLSFDTERHFNSLAGGCCVVNAGTADMHGDANVIRMRTTFKFNRPEPATEPMK